MFLLWPQVPFKRPFKFLLISLFLLKNKHIIGRAKTIFAYASKNEK